MQPQGQAGRSSEAAPAGMFDIAAQFWQRRLAYAYGLPSSLPGSVWEVHVTVRDLLQLIAPLMLSAMRRATRRDLAHSKRHRVAVKRGAAPELANHLRGDLLKDDADE